MQERKRPPACRDRRAPYGAGVIAKNSSASLIIACAEFTHVVKGGLEDRPEVWGVPAVTGVSSPSRSP